MCACREHSIGLRCKFESRRVMHEDPKRAAELAAYSTHAKLQGSHEVLCLKSAMLHSYKLENFATAAIFARRLLKSYGTCPGWSSAPVPCIPFAYGLAESLQLHVLCPLQVCYEGLLSSPGEELLC